MNIVYKYKVFNTHTDVAMYVNGEHVGHMSMTNEAFSQFTKDLPTASVQFEKRT